MLTSGRVVFTDMEEVHYGKPAAQSVAEVVKAHGAERVFLMVSGTLNRQTDEVESVRRALGNKCVGTFDKMPAHSPRSAVIAAAAQAREAKADLIVTLGGGSITDGAKAVQLCLANDVTTVEGLDKLRNADVKAPTVRQVSIPTTLSAGEFSGIAGVTNEATKVKELFRHPLTIPQAVILDPEVTRHTPMWLFLSTGIRAVDHCVEGVCSNESTEFTNASALHGLSMLARGLPKVKADPDGHASAARLPDRLVAVDGRAGRRRADGRQPRHRLRAGRGVRRAARPHLLHHAALGDALEQIGQRRPPGADRQRHGPSRQGRGRRAWTTSSAASACRAAWAK